MTDFVGVGLATVAIAVAVVAVVLSYQTGKVIKETRLWLEVLSWEIYQLSAVDPMASTADGTLLVKSPDQLIKAIQEKQKRQGGPP